MYVNMFNKIYFSCQSVAIRVLCFAQISIVGSMVQNGSQIMGRGGWDLFSSAGFELDLSLNYLCLNIWPKGRFASHTSFHSVSLSEHNDSTSEKWHY